jgi:hypothetical protein
MLRTGIAIVIGLVCFVGEATANEIYRAATPERFIGKVVQDGHCVKFVQAAANVPPTSGWRPGRLVHGDQTILPGTPIATFETNGRYISAPGNHAAIYISQDANGIWVYDQWRGQPVHKRLIRFEGGRGADKGSKSNNGKLYRVIEVAPTAEMTADANN